MNSIAGLLVCVTCALAQADDKVRSWSDVQGRTMQAVFVREVEGDVFFLKDGKLITVPLYQLSEDARKTIRELEAGKTAAAETKPAGATPQFVDPTVRPTSPPAADPTTARR